MIIHLKVKNLLKNSRLVSIKMKKRTIKPNKLKNKKKKKSLAKYLIISYWSHLSFQQVYSQKQNNL
jgi:hypothetical protein